MVNMAYCRFQNTLDALRECEEVICNSSDPRAELSPDERKAFDRLVKLCRRIADDFLEG